MKVQKGNSFAVANKFTGQGMASTSSVSPDDLRRAFESAVREIHHASIAAGHKPKRGIPIVPRARILGSAKPDAEKRALSDAARALAQLWKV
jgi:hypothetical protein